MIAMTYDSGFAPMIACVCGMCLLASGVRCIAIARIRSSAFCHAIQLHWFVILITGAFGALFHFTGEWAVNHAIAINEEFDPAQVAGDREFIALQDVWFATLLVGGALLGAIATLTIKKPNKSTQDNRGGG